MTTPSPFATDDLVALLGEFVEVFKNRPVRDNRGGVGFNHGFALYAVAKALLPKHVVESGVYKGQTTWLIEQACPDATITCIDPHPELREYTSERADYSEEDFSLHDWSNLDAARTLCFFDDHQNAFARLHDMKWWGFKHALFEDNYPVGEGDCYSLRHVRAHHGHPKLQMSEEVKLGPVQRIRNAVYEYVLTKSYPRQQILRRANSADAAGFDRNVDVYQEIPPVLRYAANDWEGEWSGAYQSEEPLLQWDQDLPIVEALKTLEGAMPGDTFRYSYICYVRMK